MKKMSEYLFLWAVGGCLYYTFEIVFRGFSHWTMFVLGGLCLVFCTAQGRAGKWRDPLGIQIIRCMIFVTSCEFITGIIVNKWLNLNVWITAMFRFSSLDRFVCLSWLCSDFSVRSVFIWVDICCIFFMEKRNRGSRFGNEQGKEI